MKGGTVSHFLRSNWRTK